MSTTIQSKSTASATWALARLRTPVENQEEEENRSGHGDDLACARDDATADDATAEDATAEDATADELRGLMDGFAETYRSFD
jgi:hypothetical protein